jgi:hypothetical protein
MRSRLFAASRPVLVVSLALPALRPCAAAAEGGGPGLQTRAVSGQGVHFLTTALVHSQQPTPTGMVQRSTETVELTGDLAGRVLYHPVSVFDFVSGTLVNTGHQVFSGTVLGSAPVLLHDDQFRFEADLTTGAVRGEVHFADRIVGPRIRCHLTVVGTGPTADGNAGFDYAGECRLKAD